MNKISIFGMFGIIFMSSILLVSGIYSNQIFAYENKAEVTADIEQENKCKKDSECKNKNEINNELNVINIVTIQSQVP